MNFSAKYYILALGLLSLETANAQLCYGDDQLLQHQVEFDVTFSCWPGDPDTYLAYQFGANAGPYSNIYAGGWCVDYDRRVKCGETYQVDSYSSYDSSFPADAIDKPENLKLVNWLINNHPVGSHVDIPNCYTGKLSYKDYQETVWQLVDNRGKNLGGLECVENWLVDQATTYGPGFEFDCDTDKKLGVILVVDRDDGTITNQVQLAEIPLAEIHGVCRCKGAAVHGDPHFKTWSGEQYDFHGICDLILLTNPQFMNGLGMEINVRSKRIQEWSYISTAVIRIGSETFEVAGQKDGDNYWLNGEQGTNDDAVLSIGGYLITSGQIHAHQREYVVHISEAEKVVFTTWKDFVRVDIKDASSNNFHGSMGLLGSFDQNGVKLGRDGVIVFDDVEEFGMEWQVLSSPEASFFHAVEGPQYPSKCELPTKMAIRRRLAESTISQAEAELACSSVREEDRDLCVFDVMATNDKDVAGAY